MIKSKKELKSKEYKYRNFQVLVYKSTYNATWQQPIEILLDDEIVLALDVRDAKLLHRTFSEILEAE